MQQITSLLHIYTNMKDSTIEQAYDLFISRFEDSLNDVFKNNRNKAYIFTIELPKENSKNLTTEDHKL